MPFAPNLTPFRRPARSLVAALVLAALVLAAQTFVSAGPVAAAPGDSLEVSAIKIAFVYNFTKFTEWPAGEFEASDASVQVCVRRNDLDIRATRTLDGKTVRDRPIRTVTIGPGDQIERCDVLFVSRFATEEDRRSVLEAARRYRILLVSDEMSFARNGGHIGLIADRQRLRFQVNLQSVSEAQLKLGSGLLQLAEIVDR